MTAPAQGGDLVVLVPDKNIEYAVRGLLERPESLGIRDIAFTVHIHVERDPGCLLRGHDFLAPFAQGFEHGLVLFDHEGCGRDDDPAEDLEAEIVSRLSAAGWNGRARAIVIDPELENWVWSDSPHVAECLGWHSDRGDLREWLAGQGLWTPDASKPERPKESMEHVLRTVRRPRSSSVYRSLAEQVSFARCTDSAFARLRAVLKEWFPAERGPEGTEDNAQRLDLDPKGV